MRNRIRALAAIVAAFVARLTALRPVAWLDVNLPLPRMLPILPTPTETPMPKSPILELSADSSEQGPRERYYRQEVLPLIEAVVAKCAAKGMAVHVGVRIDGDGIAIVHGEPPRGDANFRRTYAEPLTNEPTPAAASDTAPLGAKRPVLPS